MAEHDGTIRRHGYHALRVKGIVEETADTRSYVLDVPTDLLEAFRYRPGQFCSFRVHLDGDEYARCYSMSSAPETDDDLTVTVKRVPGGVVSNWFNDHVAVGDLVEVTGPSGTFCVRDDGRPIIGFCGGSGITPVISIAKSVLASSTRSVRLLYANRDPTSVIFDGPLRELQRRHPEVLDVHRHFDPDSGFLDAADIVAFVDGCLDADFYLCGPGPFMDLVESTLLALGVGPDAIFIERFVHTAEPGPAPVEDGDGADTPEVIVLILKGKKHEIPYHAGDTVLETARRADLAAPYSCEAGSCATCMALLREGGVAMRVNNALTPDELDEGWVLTCQSLPTSASLTVEYEPL